MTYLVSAFYTGWNAQTQDVIWQLHYVSFLVILQAFCLIATDKSSTSLELKKKNNKLWKVRLESAVNNPQLV